MEVTTNTNTYTHRHTHTHTHTHTNRNIHTHSQYLIYTHTHTPTHTHTHTHYKLTGCVWRISLRSSNVDSVSSSLRSRHITHPQMRNGHSRTCSIRIVWWQKYNWRCCSLTEEVTNRSTVREAGESGAWAGSACAEWRGDGRGEVGLNACTYIRMYVHGHMHARTHTHTHLSTHSHHFPHYTKLKLGLPTRHRNTEIANLTCAHHTAPPPLPTHSRAAALGCLTRSFARSAMHLVL